MDVGLERRRRLRATRVYLVVTPAAHGARWRSALDAAVGTGLVGVVQLREKTVADDLLRERARALRTLCDAHGALLVLNDRAHLVEEVGADGVHVGQDDLPVPAARRLVGPARLVGLSTHDATEMAKARAAGADYAGLGPCFTTVTKSLTLEPGGADLVRRTLPAAADLPVFPIGGIGPDNIADLVAAGARRVAVGAGILEAADPAAAVARIHTALDGAAREGGKGGDRPGAPPPDRASIGR